MLFEESQISNISNISTEKQDDGDIRCPNCLWYFSTNTKPYILPCFHNICDKCINNLIQKNNAKCPVCSKTFTHNDKNPFQVNFTFLNIVTKILSNKVIFCKKCNKIFYWIDHYTSCDQENFSEPDEIITKIKNTCEDGIRIIKLFNNNDKILFKYKNDIIILLSKLINNIRTNNINMLKKELDKLFTVYGKETSNFNFKDIKSNIINFLLLCINYNEYFDKNEIIDSVKPYISLIPKNNPLINNLKQSNKILSHKRYYKPSNFTSSKRKNKKDIYNNNNSGNDSSIINNNVKRMLFLKTPTKEKTNFDIKTSNLFQNNKEIKNKFEYNALIQNKKNNKYFLDNKEKKNILKKSENESEEEFIDNFDDDYHETENNNNNNKNIKDLTLNNQLSNKNLIDNKLINDDLKIEKNKIKSFFSTNETGLDNQKSNKNLNINELLGKSFLQETKVEKKIIVGLNEVKVISIKKKNNHININLEKNSNKSNSENIYKYKNNQIKIFKKTDNNNNNINKNISLLGKMNINNKNFNQKFKLKKLSIKQSNKIYTTNKHKSFHIKNSNNNSNINDNSKNMSEKKIKSFSNLNIFISPTSLRNSENTLLYNQNSKIKNIKNDYFTKPNKNSNICYISTNDLNIRKEKIDLNIIEENENNKTNYCIRNTPKNKLINISFNNNHFININKRDFNGILGINKSMTKIFNKFNNIKDIITKIEKFENLTNYINDNINSSLNQNILLSKENISKDYNFLLYNVINDFFNTQRKYLFSFKNNTKTITLFSIDYNNFISFDLTDILVNYPLFNSSIQFEFIDYINENFLLFITGGNEKNINNNKNYPSDLFLIINIKLDIIINSNNNINYKKKYIIEYKDKMPSSKSFHSIVFYNDNLYIIGGFDKFKKASNECFYFSYKNKNWQKLPNLNIPRANCSLCIYNKSFIYVFRGRNDEGELNTIECFNIYSKNNEINFWKLINVIDYGYVWNNIYNSCLVVLDENKILIFGGEDKDKLYKDTFLFDIENNNIYKGMDLLIPASFNGQGIYSNGKIYGFDFKNKNGEYEHKIHIFDVKSNYWSLICDFD